MAEPITIADAMSFDDGGSMGLRFEDAQGAVKDICLQNSLAWEGDPKSDAGHHILVLNSFFPDGKRARRVPVSGGEERALLGLLERWASLDSDAQELEKRFEALERGELSSDDFWKDLPDQARLKEVAVSILRALRARN
ncbi:MAG: hypothetical protein U0800_24770 [Isosphaeraceae bacterium]